MRKRFVKGMVIYAIVFLLIAAAGLSVFWKFIDAYEQSRPINSVKAYVAQVTAEDMYEGSQALLDQIDSNIQSREEACQLIQDSVTQELSYAKKSGESSDDCQVYVLRSGKQVIGEFSITAGEKDRFGFRSWTVSEESFDFSHLLSDAVSITVPSDFSVSLNGCKLDDSYITESGIPYDALEAFYDDYTLPTMVTYTADSFLGNLSFQVLDRNGQPVEITDETDRNTLLPACSEQEIARLKPFVEGFLDKYVTFSSSANDAVTMNFMQLKKYLVPNGELLQRLSTALDGLQWAQSKGDFIQNITLNQYVSLEEQRYLCDVTYIVATMGNKGTVETTNNLKLIILDTDSGLKVEAMTRY